MQKRNYLKELKKVLDSPSSACSTFYDLVLEMCATNFAKSKLKFV